MAAAPAGTARVGVLGGTLTPPAVSCLSLIATGATLVEPHTCVHPQKSAVP